jgi:hypothetical protein
MLLQTDKQKEESENLLQEFSKSTSDKEAGQLIEKQIAQEEGRVQAINT